MKNYFYSFDEASGAANMRSYKNGVYVGGWYVKRHYRTCGGVRVGY